MKNTERSSRKINLSRYLFWLLLLSLLTLGGAYWYITEPARKLARDIAEIKDYSKVKYEYLNNDSIVQVNENNIHEKKWLIEKLNDSDTKLTEKQRKGFLKVLKEITNNNIDENLEQETLEEKTGEERKDIVLKILQIQYSLGRIKGKIVEQLSDSQKENLYQEEKKLLDEFYPQDFVTKIGLNGKPDEDTKIPVGPKNEEDEEISNEIDKLMKHFYAKFIEVYKIKEPSIVQPIYITDENGKKLNKTNSSKVSQAEINEEIKKLKKNHQSFEGFNPDDKMHHDWKGFSGWHKKWDEEKGTATIGLTTYASVTSNSSVFKFGPIPRRHISISLDARFPLSRRGKRYETWLSKKSDGKFGGTMKFDWDILIETIAHELAHAIVNTERVSYRDDKDEKGNTRGGHGTIHYDYTKKMRKLIEKDAEGHTARFKKFWFKE
jgi:hypothetical protein